MYSQLIYEAQKAVIQERLGKASRPQTPSRPRRTIGRRAEHRIAAIIVALGRKSSPVR
jgi:hypothetical protein